MPNFKYKISRQSVKSKSVPAKLTDATIFSRTYMLSFTEKLGKPAIEAAVKQLISNIGAPLAHNNIIVGHIKLLAKLSDEEFLFLSLTRLDHVDIKTSALWQTNLPAETAELQLDVNVLMFGYGRKVIEETVRAALACFPGIAAVG